MKLHYVLLLVLCFGINSGQAQNIISLPDITSFQHIGIQVGLHTWDIGQDTAGTIYFANDDGLLCYNGSFWNLYPLSNKSNVRSLYIGHNGRIYVGGQDEIGYFQPNNNGALQYHSLKGLIPESKRDFADVWDIVEVDNTIFFRSATRILAYNNDKIAVYDAPSEWRYLGKRGNRLFAQDKGLGLMEFKGVGWQIYDSRFGKENDMLITGMVNVGAGNSLVTTFKNGIYAVGDNGSRQITDDNDLAHKYIYTAWKINANEYALGTLSGGVFVIDTAGHTLQHFMHTDGLQNDNILCLYLDKGGNLWVGTDNGINLISYSSAIRTIHPDDNNQSGVYAINIWNNALYAGTSNGLYTVPVNKQLTDLSFSKGAFSIVANSRGQVWNLQDINNQLLMGHHEGTFVVSDHTATPVISGQGSWLYVPLNNDSPATDILVGNYSGLELMQADHGHFINKSAITGLNESLRFVTTASNGDIWASHPIRGIYKIKLNASRQAMQATLYTDKNGLPATLGNYVFKIKGKIVAATENGLYEYDAATDKFFKSPFLRDVLDMKRIQYLKEDSDGNIWFMNDRLPGVIDFNRPANGKDYSATFFPELQEKILPGFTNIFPYNRENVFIGGAKGIIHLNYARYLSHVPGIAVLINRIRTSSDKDSVIFGGYFANGKQPDISLSSQWKSFHFEYTAPVYDGQENVQYSYKLAGFDNDWSHWSKKTEKDYTNIPHGTYTFMVKARNGPGNESAPVSYSFTVQPAWYQTGIAYFIYATILAGLILLAWVRHHKKLQAQRVQYEQEQEQLKYLHQLELDKSEKAIVKLENDKLEAEVEYKNKELATATMHLVQRGKLLSKIKDELTQLQKSAPSSDTLSTEVRRLVMLLNGAEKNDEHWDQFAIHFDQVHSNFLSLMKARFPQLSASDLKLCAYLRMNLSSKEISQLISISVRGVEISRYRLRKKLELPTETNLYDFLMQIN